MSRYCPIRVDRLGHGTDEDAQRPACGQTGALCRHLGIVAGEKPGLDTGLFDRIAIAVHRVAMSAKHGQLMPHLSNVATDGSHRRSPRFWRDVRKCDNDGCAQRGETDATGNGGQSGQNSPAFQHRCTSVLLPARGHFPGHASMNRSAAEILREYGPFPGVDHVHGVTYDGQRVWFASGNKLNAFDPATGKTLRSIDISADAGTAFDGRHLFQIAEDRIHRIDPRTGRVLATIPAPSGGCSGLAWAEGTLWVGQYRDRKIHQIDPETGAILRTIEASRFVTGVTWIDGELWHGTWDGDESDVRRIDPQTGVVMELLDMPSGVAVSGLASEGDRFFCGGGSSGKIRAVRRPGASPPRAIAPKSPPIP